MALARVVSFDGVSQARVEEMKAQMAEGRPDDIPATEVVMLYDADAEKSTVILFFDSEADYEQADQTLKAMPADDTPGRRVSVGRYDVAVRQLA
jgi:Cu/Ag efflux protein CusF